MCNNKPCCNHSDIKSKMPVKLDLTKPLEFRDQGYWGGKGIVVSGVPHPFNPDLILMTGITKSISSTGFTFCVDHFGNYPHNTSYSVRNVPPPKKTYSVVVYFGLHFGRPCTWTYEGFKPQPQGQDIKILETKTLVFEYEELR